MSVVVVYLLLGVLVLTVFDLITSRIRTRFRDSVADVQTRLLHIGVVSNTKMGFVLLAAVMLLFWPLVIVGFAQEKIGGRRGAKR